MGVEWAVINIYKRDEGQGEGVARALEWAVDGSPRSAAKSYSSKRQLASYPAQLRVKVKCLCLRKSFTSRTEKDSPASTCKSWHVSDTALSRRYICACISFCRHSSHPAILHAAQTEKLRVVKGFSRNI